MIQKNLLFIFSCIFFLIWIFINNITNNIKISLIVLLFLVILFLLYYVITKKYKNILIISIIWFLLWISISNYNLNKINLSQNKMINYYDWKNYNMIFVIDKINKIDDFQKQYIARLIEINWDNINNKIYALLNIDKNYDIWKWYKIKTKTKLFEIKDFNWFEYKNYMLSKHIYFTSNIYVFEIIQKLEINKIEKYLINLRNKFLDNIYSIYTKEEAIFLWWILLWARDSLPNDLKQNFNNSWLTHFIAVSWFNITIIIVFLSLLIKYFPIYFKVIFITIWIILFTILVWDTAPVIRASIMWLIWYYVFISWRKWSLISIILFTASIMVFLSPLSLNYDVSFHLSFLAVLWIAYTNKFFEKIFYFLPNILEIKSAFTLTLSAMSFTLPIMIFNFWQVSILSPLSNIAVSWTIPITMLLWFISIIIYFVFPLIWIIIWYFTWIFLKWDIMVVHFFWNLEWSIIKIDPWIYKNILQLTYFLILIFIIIWFRKKEDKI